MMSFENEAWGVFFIYLAERNCAEAEVRLQEIRGPGPVFSPLELRAGEVFSRYCGGAP